MYRVSRRFIVLYLKILHTLALRQSSGTLDGHRSPARAESILQKAQRKKENSCRARARHVPCACVLAHAPAIGCLLSTVGSGRLALEAREPGLTVHGQGERGREQGRGAEAAQAAGPKGLPRGKGRRAEVADLRSGGRLCVSVVSVCGEWSVAVVISPSARQPGHLSACQWQWSVVVSCQCKWLLAASFYAGLVSGVGSLSSWSPIAMAGLAVG